ncbi:YhcH/YjgK/YiaL family protein [Anaerotalea alkaliphila]|uniref:DUF386 domain-containing protein n=1 Tax=Anaerotalea alkaliphila TaxID=2662126 RepID=A0A7X5HVM3_9FIRM|nr:YhcH/YjgK/YiaL family protein [Anaerotalea alkaliphila]NDL67492.1 DUF386 domain-containing protein [Anaerotalea alkaliphila]
MIRGNINRREDWAAYPEAVQRALAYLGDTDFSTLEPGTYEVEGKDIYAMLQTMQTDLLENRRPEAHVVYIDIQYLLEGEERMGWAEVNGDAVVTEDKRPDKDMVYYQAPAQEAFIDLVPGEFVVFFPSDIHRPGCCVSEPMPIRKVVVKIRAALA